MAPSVHRRLLPTPSASSSAASAVPTYDPNGTAQDNLAYFDKVGHALLDNNPTAQSQGETIVNWFVAHGFNKANMEVTPDKTSIGLAAWNIEFSVRFGDTLPARAGGQRRIPVIRRARARDRQVPDRHRPARSTGRRHA